MANNDICNVYIADCSVDGGVYCYSLSQSGILAQKSFLALKSPMYLCVDGDNMHIVLRSVEEFDGNSATVTYKIGENGELCNPTKLVSTGGKVACHLSSLNGNVYSANYISGSVSCQGGKVVEHIGYGPAADRQDKSHCHFVSPSPDKKYLLAVDLGNDTIYTYDEQLNEISTAKVFAGSGCRHLAYSKDGRYVYCVNELESTVSVFEYNDGILTLGETFNALPDDFCGKNTAAAIRVKDNYLYVSNRGQDAIVAFKIKGEKLERLSFTSSGGNSPRDFDIFKNILLCTNESGEITLFKVDGGELINIPCDIKLSHPLCVVFN